MDPTVTGALIAGGAALIGFGASALGTRATLRTGQRTARDERLWAKKTALYEAINAAFRVNFWRLNNSMTEEERAQLWSVQIALNELGDEVALYADLHVRHWFRLLLFGITLFASEDEVTARPAGAPELDYRKDMLVEAMRSDLWGVDVHGREGKTYPWTPTWRKFTYAFWSVWARREQRQLTRSDVDVEDET